MSGLLSGGLFMDDQNTLMIGGLVIPLILLTIKEAFSWMKDKNLQTTDNKIHKIKDDLEAVGDRLEKTELKVDSILQMNKTMYDWHDKSDEDGVKIWYVRRSLEEALQENVKAINILAKNSEVQTKLLEDMVKQNKEINKDQMILSKLLERLIDKQ
jgi:Ni,Fe-hydrogenase I large subunit